MLLLRRTAPPLRLPAGLGLSLRLSLQLSLLALLPLLGGCLLGPGEDSSPIPIVLTADGQLVVDGARLRPDEDAGHGELLDRYLAYWSRDRSTEELLVWAPPGSPGRQVVELSARIEAAGIESYRIVRTAEPPPRGDS